MSRHTAVASHQPPVPRAGALLMTLLAAGMSAVASSEACAQLFTAPFTSLAVPNNPRCVAIGDVNGDASPDLIVGADGPKMASVLLGIGDGTFGAARTIATGSGTHAIVLEDLDGDGNHDLLLANTYANAITVLRGSADGTFVPGEGIVTERWLVALAVNDLNGDSKSDLVTANFQTSTISVRLGNGDGTFQSNADFATGDPPLAIAVGDLNGDGLNDLATANEDSATISILLGNGSGALALSRIHHIGTRPKALAIGDVNGDGTADLATGSPYPGTASVMLGQGDGSFRTTSFVLETRIADVEFSDMNADGKLDLIVTGNCSCYPPTPSTLTIFYGDGVGGLGNRQDFPTGPEPSQMAVSDLNRDGWLDVAVVSHRAHVVTPMLGLGSGIFGVVPTIPAGARPRFMATGDVNLDGRVDLVVTNDLYLTGGVSVLLGTGSGSFETSTIVTGSSPQSVAIGDLNGDGKPDLAVPDRLFNTVTVLLGNGDGTFRALAGFGTDSDPSSIVIVDLNRDGKPDLAVANYIAFGNYLQSTLSVFLGIGDGTFGPKTNFLTRAQPYSLAAGDLNADGNIDLVMGHYQPGNQVSVFIGNGDGTFGPYVTYETSYDPEFVKLVDLNEDGDLDLVAVCKSYGEVSVMLGNGDGTFRARTDLDLGLMMDFGITTYPTSAAIGDANGDGKLDIAVSVAGGDRVAVFLGNGDGTFAARTDYATGLYPASVVMEDLNGDGRPDLATTSFFSDAIAVSFNIGDDPTAVAVSLVGSTAGPDMASLRWYSPTGLALASVYRRTKTEDWRAMGTVSVDGSGYLDFTDREVMPGTRYGYRLGIAEDGRESFHGETWLTIPARSELVLHGLRPNPSGARGSVAFSLPDGHPARVELFDVRGRRLMDRQVGPLGAGTHVLPLEMGARFPPGIYLIRLTRGNRTLTAHGVMVR